MDRRAFVIDTGNGQLVPLEGEAENPSALPPLVESLENEEATMEVLGRRIADIGEETSAAVKVIWTKPEDGEPDQISLELVAPIGSSAVKQLRVESAARMLMVSGVPSDAIVHVATHRFPGLSAGTVENPITLGDIIQHAKKLHEPKGTSIQPQHPSLNTTQRKRDVVELLPTGNTSTELPVGTQEQPENGQTGERAEETNAPQKEHREKGTMPAPTTKSKPFTTYDRNRNPVPHPQQDYKINKAA